MMTPTTKTLWSRTWGHWTLSLEFKLADKWVGVYGPAEETTGRHWWLCFPLPLLPWHLHHHPQWSGGAVHITLPFGERPPGDPIVPSPERMYQEIGAIDTLTRTRGPGRWIPEPRPGEFPIEYAGRTREHLGLALEAKSEHQAMLEKLIYTIHRDAGKMDGLGPDMSNGVFFEALELAQVPFARTDPGDDRDDWSYRLDRSWLQKMRGIVGY